MMILYKILPEPKSADLKLEPGVQSPECDIITLLFIFRTGFTRGLPPTPYSSSGSSAKNKTILCELIHNNQNSQRS